MKYVYYGFGGFIGFVCGTVINLIFYWVEQSGQPILSDLVNNYGMVGRYVVTIVNTLPFLGLGLGILMVRVMFKKDLDSREE